MERPLVLKQQRTNLSQLIYTKFSFHHDNASEDVTKQKVLWTTQKLCTSSINLYISLTSAANDQVLSSLRNANDEG